MKTINRISALSFLLLFAVVTAFAANPVSVTRIQAKSAIAHQVNFPIMPDNSFCGNYVVEVRNQAGQLVAPPQNFVPGQSRYMFFEKADLSGGEVTRTAILRNAGGTVHSVCNWVITAEPATLKTNFLPGNVYNYNLYPKPVKAIKE
jgi:hypothetical protein